MCGKGLNTVFIGIEDPDEEYRNKVFNKGLTDNDVFRAVRMLHKRGVRTELTRIIGRMCDTEGDARKHQRWRQ